MISIKYVSSQKNFNEYLCPPLMMYCRNLEPNIKNYVRKKTLHEKEFVNLRKDYVIVNWRYVPSLQTV